MRAFGVPGHCYDLGGKPIHRAGQCVDLTCDKGCCEMKRMEDLPELLAIRLRVALQVEKLFNQNSDYQTVVFHRDVIADDLEVLVAVFLDGRHNEIAQHILETD